MRLLDNPDLATYIWKLGLVLVSNYLGGTLFKEKHWAIPLAA